MGSSLGFLPKHVANATKIAYKIVSCRSETVLDGAKTMRFRARV
jgi:hypothetical protein